MKKNKYDDDEPRISRLADLWERLGALTMTVIPLVAVAFMVYQLHHMTQKLYTAGSPSSLAGPMSYLPEPPTHKPVRRVPTSDPTKAAISP